MAALDLITARVRLDLQDTGSLSSALLIGDGTTQVFNLPEENYEIANPPLSVILGTATPTVLVLNQDFVMDAKHGFITFTRPPANLVPVTVAGIYYEDFITSELQSFVNSAALKHLHNRNDVVQAPFTASVWSATTLDTMPVVEQHPVAILAEIEALWAKVGESSTDIDVSTNDGVTIPRSQRYQQLMTLIEAKKAEYAEICALLNVGIHSIEMFDLRRVSRATGRYVPLYRDREYDDSATPQRVYPRIDTKAP